MIGLSIVGSYIIWIGLFFSVSCTFLRWKDLNLNDSFTKKVFWKYIFAIFFFILMGILVRKFAINMCEENVATEHGILADQFFKCLSTMNSTNLLAPIPAWIMNCKLWRKMTEHKIEL